MRKKQLIKQMELLVAKNNELFNDNVKLAKEVLELKSELEALKETVNASANIKTTTAEDAEPSVSVKSVAPIEPIINDNDNILDVKDNDASENNAESGVSEVSDIDISLDSVCEGDCAEYASELIGKIVLRSAEVCNTFAESGGQNAKDLINLAIGMTEVFKADALSIVTEKISDEDKNSKLLEKYTAATEYFDLLLTQIA